MGLFTKKIPVTVILVGKCKPRLSVSENQCLSLLKRSFLPQIIKNNLGDKAAENKKYLLAFREWSSRDSYRPETIREIAKDGFNAFNMTNEVKQMRDDIDRALVERIGITGSYRPSCFMFPSGDPLNGIFLLMSEEKVKEDRFE